ncbi:DUF6648 family protein [Peptostreptococcaceae bacterium AGR-M142]
MNKEERFFKKFIEQRDIMIQQLLQGDLNKRDYIEDSYFYLKDLNMEPYEIIDEPLKAIYNYQFYNLRAKYIKLKLNDLIRKRSNLEKQAKYRQDINELYAKKDEATLSLMEVVNYKNVEGYYIKTKAKGLKNKLLEIVFYDFESVIFHSMHEEVLKKLKENKVFKEDMQLSLIDDYINERY